MTAPTENPWLKLDNSHADTEPTQLRDAIETQPGETPPTNPTPSPDPQPANPWYGLGRREPTDGSEQAPEPEPE
ncbi:MAG: hypothetical protein ACRDNS_24900, partial [Trebonia sp.]